MPIRDMLIALLAAAILGCNFVFVKFGLEQVPPLLLTGLRFLLAAIPGILFIPRPKVRLDILIAYGFFVGVLQFGLLFLAIHLGMSAGLSSLVIQLQVFLTIGLASLLFREKLSSYQLMGAIVAGFGLLIIGIEKAHSAALLPFALVIIAAFAWSIANILTKFAGQVDPVGFVVWSSLASPGPLFLLSIVFEPGDQIVDSLTNPHLLSIVSVLFIAYGATVTAFGLWTSLLRRHSAPNVMPFALLIPVFGILSTCMMSGEVLTVLDVAGGLVVFLGLAVNVAGARRAAQTRASG